MESENWRVYDEERKEGNGNGDSVALNVKNFLQRQAASILPSVPDCHDDGCGIEIVPDYCYLRIRIAIP